MNQLIKFLTKQLYIRFRIYKTFTVQYFIISFIENNGNNHIIYEPVENNNFMNNINSFWMWFQCKSFQRKLWPSWQYRKQCKSDFFSTGKFFFLKKKLVAQESFFTCSTTSHFPHMQLEASIGWKFPASIEV